MRCYDTFLDVEPLSKSELNKPNIILKLILEIIIIFKTCQSVHEMWKVSDGEQYDFLQHSRPPNPGKEMVFCSDLLWEKIVLVIEKNIWNSRLKAENLQKVWYH